MKNSKELPQVLLILTVTCYSPAQPSCGAVALGRRPFLFLPYCHRAPGPACTCAVRCRSVFWPCMYHWRKLPQELQWLASIINRPWRDIWAFGSFIISYRGCLVYFCVSFFNIVWWLFKLQPVSWGNTTHSACCHMLLQCILRFLGYEMLIFPRCAESLSPTRDAAAYLFFSTL